VLVTTVENVIDSWGNKRGISVKLSSDQLQALIADVDHHWSDAERENFLKRLDQSYATFRQPPAAETKRAKGKGKKAEIVEAGS
ncbi:MAG TPA: hypothetical protein V6C65_08245, partial [Allocoleopsis sp.]